MPCNNRRIRLSGYFFLWSNQRERKDFSIGV
nr:MAG TPA: hypothetical protein [Caudoviricetes sp.]